MSQYLWGRKYRIQVVTGMEKDKDGKETGNEIALDVSNLHCVFEVHKKRDEGGSYAVVKIYNLNSQTEQKLITEGDRLIIEAGYKGLTKQDHLVDIDTGEPWVTQVDTRKTAMDADDGVQVTIGTEPARYGKIFDGKITWPSRSKESNVDYVLTLMAIDGDDPLNLNYISKTVGKGLNQRQILETVSKDSETKIPTNVISDNLSPQRLPRGKGFFGSPRDYIRDVCRGNAASYYIEDGQLNTYRLQDVPANEAMVVTPQTGLIGMPSQTQYGVDFKMLLNPAVKLQTMIKIQGSEVNETTVTPGEQQTPLDDEWIYQAIEVTHRGDTRGNDWYTEVVGISRYGTGSIPALMANEETNANGQ